MKLNAITSGGFSSFFWTQFLGAFNDNFFKNALVVLIAYRGVQMGGIAAEELVALAGALFIFPFFVFSPLAGQLADKFEKSKIIRLTKISEAIIMAIAGIGFLTQSYAMLLSVLFFMGAQSAFFGPVKFSIIPDLVAEKNLTAGNAFIELGTFIAILLGTIVGGMSTSIDGIDNYLGLALVAVAILGYLLARQIPEVAIGDPELKIEYNPFPEFGRLYRIATEKIAVSNAILGISWFWFFGAAILSVLPIYVSGYLFGNEAVVTVFLSMFTLGIGLGSMICEKLSFERVEIGIVPLGSLGMTVFLLDLFFLVPDWTGAGELLNISQFLAQGIAYRLLIDFFFMSVFGGLFILPLYTLLQERSHPETRSRVIAANNIMNAIFMVLGSILVLVFYRLELNTAEIFGVFAVMNVLVAIYIYTVVPEFTLRFYTWLLSHVMYKVEVEGAENIPKEGAVILAPNHVTFVDWLLVSGACKRPSRFVMFYKYFEVPVIKRILKQAKVIPIAGAKENPALLKAAFEQISTELSAGEPVCIFPEGKLTRDGKLNPFRPGVQKMVDEHKCPVVPVVIEGMWGSVFSHSKNKERIHRRKIKLRMLPPISAENFNFLELEALMAKELGEEPPSKKQPES